jgi:hypothetical protein
MPRGQNFNLEFSLLVIAKAQQVDKKTAVYPVGGTSRHRLPPPRELTASEPSVCRELVGARASNFIFEAARRSRHLAGPALGGLKALRRLGHLQLRANHDFAHRGYPRT